MKLAAKSAPFFPEGEFRFAKRNYIKTKLQDFSSGEHDEPRSNLSQFSREDGIAFFLRSLTTSIDDRDPRFYLVLADSGMGKTTFLMNLLRYYIKKLRIDGIDMRLVALGHKNARQIIANYPSEAKWRTILLLDAFDEDPTSFDKGGARFEELMKQVEDFRKVVITCRRQFFGKSAEIPKYTGFLSHGPRSGPVPLTLKYVAPFSDDDVTTYLKRRFWLRKTRRLQAMSIIAKARNLMARPMLLAHINELIEQKRVFTNSAEIYAVLVRHWVYRELQKLEKRGGAEYHEDSLMEFANELAVAVWRQRKANEGFYISSDDVTALAKKMDVNIDKFLPANNASKSLLTPSSDGQLKFAHLSIFEFIVASVALREPEFAEELRLDNYEGVPQAETFLQELLRVPPPDGCFYCDGASKLSEAIDCDMNEMAKLFQFRFATEGHRLILICWHDTYAKTLDMLVSLSKPFFINIWFKPGQSCDAKEIHKWSKVAQNDNVLRIDLKGERLLSARNVSQEFLRVFTAAGCADKLGPSSLASQA